MNAENKNLIYKALAVTLAIMFFSVFFSQVIYEKKMDGINSDLNRLRSSIDEARFILSMKALYKRNVRQRQGRKNIEQYLQSASDTIYNTGTYISKLAGSERNQAAFNRVSREWVILAANAWADFIRRNNGRRAPYILFLYPPDCTECIAYRTVLNRVHRSYGSKIWIFAIPVLEGNSVVRLIKNYYNINEVPAIVVNGKLLQKGKSLDRVEGMLLEQGFKPEKKEKKKKDLKKGEKK